MLEGVLNGCNPEEVSNSPPIQQPDSVGGGEGVSNSTDQMLKSVNESALASQPQRPIEVGDLVTINSPGSKYHGKQATVIRLKVEQFQGQEVQLAEVTIAGERRAVEVQLSWLRRTEGESAKEA